MRQPIGLYLADFGPSAPAWAVGTGLPCFDAVAIADDAAPLVALAEPVPDEESTDTGSAIDDEPDLPALPLETARSEPDVAALVGSLQAEHAAALAAARQHWAEQEGATLAAGLAAALAELETRIADTLAPLLEPFLVQAAQMTALAQLRDALGLLLGDHEGSISVGGPADLLDALRRGLAARPGLTFVESDVPDVTITLGETRIRSQLAGWAGALESALGLPA